MLTWPWSALLVIGGSGLIWAALVLRERRVARRHHVSETWLDRQAWVDQRAGDVWEGPRWHDARTVAKMRRIEARELRMQERKRA